MESEKVKEIKKALDCCSKGECGVWCPRFDKKNINHTCQDDMNADALTLINELESENAYRQEHIELWFKKNEEKKKRIAELEKEIEENAFYSKGYAQGIKNTYEVVIPDKLKQFAERLKEKFDEQKYFYETASISHRDISLTALNTAYRCLDETLKEYEK